MRRLTVLMWLSLCLMTQAFAAVNKPVAVLEHVTADIVQALKSNQGLYQSDHQALVAMIDRTLMPYVATETIAKNVLGRQHWQQATPAERQTFIRLFVRMVVQVYAGAFAAYTDQRIRYFPIRAPQEQQAIVNVRSSVYSPKTQQNIMISYQMMRDNGQWKIIDFSVDGISLTNNYRSQFSSVLGQQGLPALLAKMQQKLNKDQP